MDLQLHYDEQTLILREAKILSGNTNTLDELKGLVEAFSEADLELRIKGMEFSILMDIDISALIPEHVWKVKHLEKVVGANEVQRLIGEHINTIVHSDKGQQFIKDIVEYSQKKVHEVLGIEIPKEDQND